MGGNNKVISIVVPLYKGEKYIGQILDQVGKNARLVPELTVELVLYNDYPDEDIVLADPVDCKNLEVKIVNSNENKGIHAARVSGLNSSSGGFVVFLDQDDILYPDYLRSQIDAIGEGDVVVCKAIHDGKSHYSSSYRFEKVVTAEHLLNCWNSIVSPGQVLLKRSIIPQSWIDKPLKNNGADDYYLWLLLAGMKVVFVHNDVILFEHTVKGDNTSLDTNRMMDSEDEMIGNLIDSGVFDNRGIEKLLELRKSLRRIHIKELEDYREAYYCYLCFEGADLERFHSKKIGIYGAGIIGRSLGKILARDKRVDIIYIDRNEASICVDAAVFSPQNIPDDIDIIVVTPLPDRDKIAFDIKSQVKCKVYSLRSFIKDCLE